MNLPERVTHLEEESGEALRLLREMAGTHAARDARVQKLEVEVGKIGQAVQALASSTGTAQAQAG